MKRWIFTVIFIFLIIGPVLNSVSGEKEIFLEEYSGTNLSSETFEPSFFSRCSDYFFKNLFERKFFFWHKEKEKKVLSDGEVVPSFEAGVFYKKDYLLVPGRVFFNFNNEKYAIQIRKVGENYTTFLVMVFLSDNSENYSILKNFTLVREERVFVDLDKDNFEDIYVKLNGVVLSGKYGTVRSANFSVGGNNE
jgi:hypothetical protein